VATRGEGIDALLAALDEHGRFLSPTEEGRSRRRARRTSNAEHALSEAVTAAVLDSLGSRLRELAEAVADRALEPHAATAELLRELGLDSPKAEP
jgi:LAO/AO transport system kinase